MSPFGAYPSANRAVGPSQRGRSAPACRLSGDILHTQCACPALPGPLLALDLCSTCGRRARLAQSLSLAHGVTASGLTVVGTVVLMQRTGVAQPPVLSNRRIKRWLYRFLQRRSDPVTVSAALHQESAWEGGMVLTVVAGEPAIALA